MVKTCTKCKLEKDVFEFHKDKYKKDGLRSECKSCQKEYREDNKELIKESKKKYYKVNKEKIKEYEKANKEKIKEYKKEYNKEYRKANKEYDKKYYQANKEKIIECKRKYQRKRRKTDDLFKLKCNLRGRTWSAFRNKGYSKNTKTQQMLGVEWEVTKQHIERQFTKGMNWNNYGEWHIDHIIPLSSAKTPERLKQLCHYTNLQPLWAEENLSKKDIINGQQTLLRI